MTYLGLGGSEFGPQLGETRNLGPWIAGVTPMTSSLSSGRWHEASRMGFTYSHLLLRKVWGWVSTCSESASKIAIVRYLSCLRCGYLGGKDFVEFLAAQYNIGTCDAQNFKLLSCSMNLPASYVDHSHCKPFLRRLSLLDRR